MEQTALQLQVEKNFSVSKEALADAWINPEKLKQWWKPAGNDLVEVENEMEEGGNIKYVFNTQHGEQAIVITGKYREVTPGEKLVYTWNWHIPQSEAVTDNEFVLTIVFTGNGNSSTISVTQQNFRDQDSIHPHQKGWEDALEDLHAFLS